jgi:lambda family phage portal protein
MERNGKKGFLRKASESADSLIGLFSPERAFKRKQYRFAYDAIDGTRLRKLRSNIGGTGDTHLTDIALWKLREICRDLERNNPLVKGILRTDRDSVIGSGVRIEAKTQDKDWNQQAEDLFNEWALSCEVTGRFTFNQFLRLAYLSYRRDGDMAVIFVNDKLQAVEGEQIGNPTGLNQEEFKYIKVINGVVYNKIKGQIVGYYIGQPALWGYIEPNSVNKYTADIVHHIFNPDRFSYSRGEPVLTSSIDAIDKLSKYIDAELVAAAVNACFSAFVTRNEPSAEWNQIGETSTNEQGRVERQEKLEPGMIMYGEQGEDIKAIGQTRPGTLFDPFVLRLLSMIGRPLCMPLMLITLDFAGATFMNARIAYQKAQENWLVEQNLVVKPFVSRVWKWKIGQFIEDGRLAASDEFDKHEIVCHRWPYVDPTREAQAAELNLKNRTTTLREICGGQGKDWKEDVDQGIEERAYIAAKEKEKLPLNNETEEELATEGTE